MFRHIVSAAALLAASTALASAVTVTLGSTELTSDYSDTYLTYTATSGTIVATDSYTLFTETGESGSTTNYFTTDITFTLDLSSLSSLSADTKILEVYSSSAGASTSGISLWVTTSGTLVFGWAGSEWNTGSYTYTLSTNSDTLTLTLVANTGTTSGTYVTDTDGATVGSLSASGLRCAEYNASSGTVGDYDTIYVNSNLITSVTVTATLIPEPSAFGMLAGVGALALVAARRRRTRKAA